MHTTTHTHIIRDDSNLASMEFSIRAYVPYTARTHALRLLYTQMLMAGAGSYTRAQFQDALSVLGGSLSVSLDDGFIDISLYATSDVMVKMMRLFETMLVDPTFSPRELKRVKTLLTNTLTNEKENARAEAYRMFIQSCIVEGDRRMVYDIDTLIAEIPRISTKEIIAFHHHIRAFPWHYTAGGNETCIATIEKTITRIEQKIRVAPETPLYTVQHSTPHQHPLVSFQHIPHKQNIEFSIGNALPLTRGNDQYPAFVFGMNVLGLYGGFAGRLMSTVREKEGLTYSIYGRTEDVTHEETGVWRIMTFFNPQDVIKGITSTLREIHSLHRDGVTKEEVVRFKHIISTRYILTEDSLIKKVLNAHTRYKVGDTEETYTTFKNEIEHMTRDRINDALHTFLHPQSLVVCGAGPTHGIEKGVTALLGKT